MWGCNEEFISSGRLDDQQCVYGILKGLLTAKNARSIGVAAFFDNEEVGSGTKQGAASTFLYDVLHRIAQSLGGNDEDFHRAVASSFMVSADNAHAVHPNHPEHTDVNNCTYMNKGVVIKTHAGQKYTSEGSLFKVAAVQLLHQLDEREGVLCTGGLVAGVHGQLGQADVHTIHGHLCHRQIAQRAAAYLIGTVCKVIKA